MHYTIPEKKLLKIMTALVAHNCDFGYEYIDNNTHTISITPNKNHIMDMILNGGTTKLSPCPFCKKQESVYLIPVSKIETGNIDSDELIVICDAQKKGCGASAGSAENAVSAIRKWEQYKGALT